MNDDARARWVMEALGRHEASLLRYAASLVGSERAADVVQDTFLRLCSTAQQDVEGHLAAWLFTVCKHRAIELGRKERRLQSLEESNVDQSPDSGPVSKLERKEPHRKFAGVSACGPCCGRGRPHSAPETSPTSKRTAVFAGMFTARRARGRTDLGNRNRRHCR